QDRVRVLIVDGDLVWDDPRRFGADYVETGLTGQPSARFRVSEPRSSNPAPEFLRITTRRAREVSPADLAGMDLVFLCNVPVPEPGRPGGGVSQEFVNRLAEFVGNGGGLVIGCGEHAKAVDPGGGPAYNRVLG